AILQLHHICNCPTLLPAFCISIEQQYITLGNTSTPNTYAHHHPRTTIIFVPILTNDKRSSIQ
ncbi:MAG: hypothetical protein ACOVO1_08600, partial [Chitinophagaceae bacterium]